MDWGVVIILGACAALAFFLFSGGRRKPTGDAPNPAPSPGKRGLATLTAGDTVVLSDACGIPGRWKVEKAHKFESASGDWTLLELRDGDDPDKVFIELHRKDDGTVRAFVSSPIDATEYNEVDDLDLEYESPPAEISWRDKPYTCSAVKPAKFFRNGGGEHPLDVIFWEYSDPTKTRTVTFEFWSERGRPVTSEGRLLDQDAVVEIRS